MSEVIIVDDNKQVWIMQDGELANQIKLNATKNIREVLKKVEFEGMTNTLELITAIKADLGIKE